MFVWKGAFLAFNARKAPFTTLRYAGKDALPALSAGKASFPA